MFWLYLGPVLLFQIKSFFVLQIAVAIWLPNSGCNLAPSGGYVLAPNSIFSHHVSLHDAAVNHS